MIKLRKGIAKEDKKKTYILIKLQRSVLAVYVFFRELGLTVVS